LHQAAYVLHSLINDTSQDTIADTLRGDRQLVAMWIMFVLHNHWVSRELNDTGKITWVATDKGNEMLAKFEYH